MMNMLNPPPQNRTWQVPEWLLSDSSKWAQNLVEMYEEPVSFPASLPPSQGQIIHDLVLRHKPITVVEIGCFIGVSSVWIGSALKKLGRGRLFSVDMFFPKNSAQPDQADTIADPLGFATEKIKTSGLGPIVEFIKMSSIAFGKRLRQYTDNEIDFLFIDGDHTVGGCVDDFLTFYPRLKIGGHILFHDIHPEVCGWDGPRYVLDRIIKGSSGFEISEIRTEPKNYGMALVTKTREDKTLYPWRNPKLEVIRRLHRQVHRVQAGVRYSSFYQNRIKKAEFFNKHIKHKVKRFLKI